MIELKDVCFSYGKTPILDSLTCRMPDGAITALIGPNGAGKSTALRLCARLIRPQSGLITIDGKQQYDAKSFAHTLAFLPQSRPVPMITVRDLVMHGRFARLSPLRRPSVHDEEAVLRALEMTGLTELAGRELTALSGGQRQKAFLAMLIAQEAPNVLLDEPFTHLDVGCQLEVADILRSLRDEGKAITVVLHDLSLVPQLCDHALLLHQGRLLYDGPADGLYETDAIERAFGVRALRRETICFERKT